MTNHLPTLNSTAMASEKAFFSVTLVLLLIIFAVGRSAAQTATISNTATVTASGQTDPTPGNNSGTAVLTVNYPDLTIAKTTTSTFIQGGTASYKLTVTNSGVGSSSGTYTLTDAMPSGLTITTVASGSDWNCTASTATNVSCVSTTVIPSGSSPSAVNVSVNIAGNTPSSITNTAIVSGGGETNTTNNSSSITSAVSPAAPSLTCPTNTTVAVCQTQATVNSAFATWLATASASGGCNGVLTNDNTGAPLACGGSTTVTFTYTSTCAPTTTTCQATFTVPAPASPTPVFANCTNNTINLGCNPGSLPSCSGIAGGSFGGAVTASNSCGSVPVNCTAGTVSINGCTRTQVFTFDATACGQTVTCTRTYTWTQVTPPSFNGTCGNGVINLGCNPTTLPACDPNITASNECGPISVTCNVGTIQVNGCNRQQTLTYVANAPGCGTFSTCIKIYNWQVTTEPVITNSTPTVDLGCNPATLPSCANYSQTAFGGGITAANECGNVSVSCSAGSVTSNGCDRTQEFTFTASACGFTATSTRTYSWKVATAPVFANCTSSTIDLGCDPTTLPICDAAVTASDACGAATVVCTAGTITANGCTRTQVFTYVATGACGATSTCSRTYTWTVSSPVTLTCPTNTTEAACQTQAAVNSAFATWLATASASGGCNGVLTNDNTGAPLACGGSTTVTFTYTSTCGTPTTTCQATFTVAASPTVVLTCPANTTAASCQTQAAVNAAFATWLGTVSASGGCNGVLTNNNTGAPSACGGSTTVTFTYQSSCAPTTTTCQATFTVAAPPTVVLTCPTNQTEAFGQTQAMVNAAFATWLGTVSASGGCNGVLTNNNTGAPTATGGSTTVTFTYQSSCAPTTTTCQATFMVSSVPPVVLNCPTNTTVAACQTQAAVNGQFAAWLATASASGGCNGVLTNNNTGAPSACGGSTTVTFTYTSTCAPTTTTCQATFTVPASPTVVLTCPTNTTVAACQTQAAVNSAFAAWLATASASGGCNGVLTNNNTGAPSACGGSTIVTFTYTSTCAPTTTTCQATFIVATSPPVVLTCPANTTTAACQSQAAVNSAFAAWLATASASGGCNGVLTNNNTGAPSACGGSTTVTFTYTSTCTPTTTTCQATFTVPICSPPPTIVANGSTTFCPGSSITLSSDAASGNQWYKDGNPINGATGQTYSATEAGDYTVVVTVSDCASSPSNVITVTLKPVPSATLSASQTDVCPNTQVTLTALCSIPNSTVNWNPGAPTVIPDAATTPYTYKASCSFDGCTGAEASVEVRTHRILVDLKEVGSGTLPQPIVKAVKDNMGPVNTITAAANARRWTMVATGCAASESAVFKLTGPINFNSIDNGAPYALFANVGAEYFAVDHPNYGSGMGGFPNGTYNLTVELRSADGVGGPFPKNRVATGVLLASRTLQFTVGSSGATRLADDRQPIADHLPLALVAPNPISHTLTLTVHEAKGQPVTVSLTDIAGRDLMQRGFVPKSNAHMEDFDVHHLTDGLYYLKVNAGDRQQTLKVIKVE